MFIVEHNRRSDGYLDYLQECEEERRMRSEKLDRLLDFAYHRSAGRARQNRNERPTPRGGEAME